MDCIKSAMQTDSIIKSERKYKDFVSTAKVCVHRSYLRLGGLFLGGIGLASTYKDFVSTAKASIVHRSYLWLGPGGGKVLRGAGRETIRTRFFLIGYLMPALMT